MQLYFRGTYSLNPRELIRRTGYAEFRDPRTRETSYVRRLSGGFYPRFHAYLFSADDGFVVNLHLDQKQPSYGSHTAHSGEYDGEVVEQEGERVRQVIESLATGGKDVDKSRL